MPGYFTSRRNFLAGLGASVIIPAAAARAQSEARSPLAALWQGISLVDSNNNDFSLKSTGKPLTLVKLWANWCPVCLSEIDQLTSLVAAVGPQTMEVILVSHPNWWEADQDAAKRRQIKFRLATPGEDNSPSRINAALMNANGLYAVPRTMVFRNAGEDVVLAHQGAMDWTDDSVVSQLRSAIA